jgi:tetratricopeptide (TPR) repeat protein
VRVTLRLLSLPLARLMFANVLGILIAWPQESWTDAFRARRFADAVAISESELKQTPRDATRWTKRALALEGLGRNAESIESFQRALELRPTFIPALEGAAEVAYKIRDRQAESFIAKLLKIDPRNTTAHAMAGVLAFEKHDCNTATRNFEQTGPELAQNQQAYSFFGACLLELNNAQKAVLVFTTLSKQFPESVNVRYNLGYAQFLNGNAGDAIVTLRPLTIGEHPDASALNLVASAEAADGHLGTALEDLRKAAQLKPDAEDNYLDFATLCLEHDSLDLAEETVNIGLQNIPASARLYSMRGIINAQKNKFDESANDFEQANRLSPQKLYGSVGLSVLYAESKHPEESERILRSKLQTAPADATLNYLLADLLVNKPSGATDLDWAEAKAALLRSVAAKPDFSNAHALLGKVYRRTGENAKAIEQLKLALSHDPQNRVALNQMVSLLRSVGRAPEAAPYSASLRRVLQQAVSTDVDQARVRIVRVQ